MGRRRRRFGAQQVSDGISVTCESDDLRATSATGSRGRARRRASRRATAAVVVEVPKVQVCAHDLLAAISSLYEDELRPYGRLIRKRLAERRSVMEKPCWELSDLMAGCHVTPGVELNQEEPGEWSARLVGRSDNFVDMYCRADAYPVSLWAGLAAHVASLGDAGVLPGGRYSCARALVAADLEFLTGRSLGQVCHIVQLAMTEKKLLGYLDGTITSYARSHSMMKDSAAESRVGSSNAFAFPIATWAMARKGLADVLAELPDKAMKTGRRHLPLSTLKRLFRSKYQLELSETALGYTKLSDLLQDPQMQSVCSVRLLEQGYVVLPPAPGVKEFQAFEAESTCTGSLSTCPSDVSPVQRVPFCPEEPLCFDGITQPRPSLTPKCGALSQTWFAQDGCISSIVQNTFIHAAVHPLTPLSSATFRSQSLPKDTGSNHRSWEATCQELGFRARWVAALSDAAIDQCKPAIFASAPNMPLFAPAAGIGLSGSASRIADDQVPGIKAFDDQTLFFCEPLCLTDASEYDWTDFPSPTPWTPTHTPQSRSLLDNTLGHRAQHLDSSPSHALLGPMGLVEQAKAETMPDGGTLSSHSLKRVLCLDEILF